MMYPQKIETVHIETLDNELCIYDWQRMEVHSLNPTAAKVWELCDGQTSPAQMAEKLQAELDTPHAEDLVWLTLARLEKAHLLQEAVVKPTGHKILTRRELLKGLGVAAALLPVVSSIVAPGPIEAQTPAATATATGNPTATPTGTLTPTATPTITPTPTRPTGSQTFNFTGAEQQFIVPAGVTSVTIQADGAQGGTLANGVNASGEGGRVTATISVTPGETLFVYVGGQGGNASSGVPGAGGFNGGGDGGDAPTTGVGAAGGGASDVRQGGNTLNDRVVVAGGGGGASGLSPGGEGGYPDGLDGVPSDPNNGKGGTQAGGGAGGSGADGGNPGTAGTFGTGGTGGATTLGAGGGGGGGGYYGGGGGGADEDPSTPDFNSGGGGSGFAIPTATNVSSTIGGRQGNGQVVISF